MDNIKKEIGEIFTGILSQARDELLNMTQAELERFWFFKYDEAKSYEYNLYLFYDYLGMYSRKCRQWEEIHNGTMCVVERVRDTYLMPKIREFITAHNQKVLSNG